MNYQVYVTKGELATIMGVAAFGAMVRKLKSGTLGDTGLDVVEALDYTNGVYLDNPEIGALIPILVSATIIDQPTADRVTAYITAQQAAVTPPAEPPALNAPPLVRSLSLWGNVQREWGYEVRLDLTMSDGAVYNEVLTFAAEPSQAELDQAVTERIRQVNTRVL